MTFIKTTKLIKPPDLILALHLLIMCYSNPLALCN